MPGTNQLWTEWRGRYDSEGFKPALWRGLQWLVVAGGLGGLGHVADGWLSYLGWILAALGLYWALVYLRAVWRFIRFPRHLERLSDF